MKNRFMKLYRIYRRKKFNEPYDENKKTGNFDDDDDGYDFNPQKYIPKPIKEQEDMILKKIAELNNALKPAKPVKDGEISDLHTVNEDYDDEYDDDMDATDPNLNP